jgi:hypothetical protein
LQPSRVSCAEPCPWPQQVFPFFEE